MGRAIVREADAFLFDEPLSNLDAKLRGQMRTEIARLQRRLGITTVYVTHDQTEAMTLGDRVCVLRKGVIQQVASPRELYEQPVNLFVAGFIGSPPMNFLPATVDGTPAGHPVRADRARRAPRRGRGRQGAGAGRHPAGVLRGRLPRRRGQAPPRLDVHRARGRHRVARRLAVRLHPLRGAGGDPAQLKELSRELDSDQLRTQAIVSIDATSRMREGRDAEFWLDTRKIHVFDPETGDNLTRDAEAGAELTRLAEQDRVEQTEDARAEMRTDGRHRGDRRQPGRRPRRRGRRRPTLGAHRSGAV